MHGENCFFRKKKKCLPNLEALLIAIMKWKMSHLFTCFHHIVNLTIKVSLGYRLPHHQLQLYNFRSARNVKR